MMARKPTRARSPRNSPARSPMVRPPRLAESARAAKSCTAPMKIVPSTTHAKAGSQPHTTAMAGPTIGAGAGDGTEVMPKQHMLVTRDVGPRHRSVCAPVSASHCPCRARVARSSVRRCGGQSQRPQACRGPRERRSCKRAYRRPFANAGRLRLGACVAESQAVRHRPESVNLGHLRRPRRQLPDCSAIHTCTCRRPRGGPKEAAWRVEVGPDVISRPVAAPFASDSSPCTQDPTRRAPRLRLVGETI